jgi:glycosyltransferase involved in cell wall biosynthesis
MSTRGRLCFYAPYLYPVAAGGEIEFVGGTEVRQWTLARALAERGFDVAVATCDFGQEADVIRDGVSLLRTYSTEAGVPVVRLFYPRLWKALRTLRRANADVYLANGASIATGWAYDAAKLSRSCFVFLAAHDDDARRSLPALTTVRERWWYLRALRGADARVAQTETQRLLFRDNFAVETQVINNPVDLPFAPADVADNDTILWVATYKASKRPEWFTELARLLPGRRFVMVGGIPQFGASTRSWEDAKQAAGASPNLAVHGFVDHRRIGEFLRRAALFVHTSPAEGFPMAVLEAWSYGVPTVTAVDPDGVVARHGIGEIVSSRDQLLEVVTRLMRDPAERTRLGARARAYVESHHSPDRTFDPLAELLDRLIGETRRSRNSVSR